MTKWFFASLTILLFKTYPALQVMSLLLIQTFDLMYLVSNTTQQPLVKLLTPLSTLVSLYLYLGLMTEPTLQAPMIYGLIGILLLNIGFGFGHLLFKVGQSLVRWYRLRAKRRDIQKKYHEKVTVERKKPVPFLKDVTVEDLTQFVHQTNQRIEDLQPNE